MSDQIPSPPAFSHHFNQQQPLYGFFPPSTMAQSGQTEAMIENCNSDLVGGGSVDLNLKLWRTIFSCGITIRPVVPHYRTRLKIAYPSLISSFKQIDISKFANVGLSVKVTWNLGHVRSRIGEGKKRWRRVYWVLLSTHTLSKLYAQNSFESNWHHLF